MLKDTNCKCVVCGKPFYTRPYIIKKGYGKYCSHACHGKSNIIRVTNTCKYCGKDFLIERWKSDQTFCSKSCRMSSQMSKPPVYVKCENCGVEFKIRPYKLDKVKLHFCSRKCTYDYRAKIPYYITVEGIEKSAKAKIGKKRLPFSDEHKKHIGDTRRGEKNWHWMGGKSFEPYCPKFDNEFKEYIRDKFNRKCFICGGLEGNIRHAVHHIDYNKNSICNGHGWAFVPLCMSCHNKTQHQRWHWFNLLICYWANDPEVNFNSF